MQHAGQKPTFINQKKKCLKGSDMQKQFVKRYSLFIERDWKQDAYIAQVTHNELQGSRPNVAAGSPNTKHKDILNPQ